jgi:RpiR family carbohydrate utilization transcriptional regulator
MYDLIKDRLDTLSPAERRVAEWIIEHPRRATRTTLAELAEACGSSEPTVIRFCRRFGLRGFRELAPQLSEALSHPIAYIHHDVTADDLPRDAAVKVVDASIQALFRLRSELAVMPIEPAIQALAAARQLVFVGLGASGHVARDACHKFFRLGIPATALADTPSILQYAAIADPSDVMTVISSSGRWPDLARAAASARRRGATLLAITEPAAALAAEADILLPCRAREDTSVYTPMSSRLVHLAILDALQVGLALAIGQPAVDKLKLSKSALS